MSATAGNPDRRPLPDGWITRWDDNYRAWYYVDTRAQPPRSSWDHPLGLPPSSPPGGYAPPSNAPPNRNYGGNAPPYNSQQGQSYSEPVSQPPYSGGFQSGTQEPRVYPQQGQQGSTGGYRNPGWQQPGWQQPQQGYAQSAPPAAQQPSHGGRNALLAGGAGLLGGLVLTEAFEHHEHREEERAYDQGYDQGFDNGVVDDNNFGGW